MKKPTSNPNPRPGTRVRFLTDNLGASKRDELYYVTGETYGLGDTGKVAFNHPNKKALPDWFYVEVESKEVPGEKRYVGVTATMVDPLAYREGEGSVSIKQRGCSVCGAKTRTHACDEEACEPTTGTEGA